MIESETIRKKIVILAFNDFHGAIEEAEAQAGDPGAAKLAGKLLELYNEQPQHTIIVAVGDLYEGSALATLSLGKPINEMLKAVGVRYSALGNHEFHWSKNTLKKWQEESNMKFLCANVNNIKDGGKVDFAEPYAIEEFNGIRLGLIGLITKKMPSLLKSDEMNELEFIDPTHTAKKLVKELKEDHKCDLVIALFHGSVVQNIRTSVLTGECVELAKEIPDLDGIFSGHTHMLVCGKHGNIPIIQGSRNGRFISRMDVEIDEVSNSANITPSLISISSKEEKANAPINKQVETIINQCKEELYTITSKVVGYIDMELKKKSEVADWANRLIYNFVLRKTGVAHVVIANRDGWRPNGIPLPEGNITLNYIYSLLPIDKSIMLMKMRGLDLLNLLNTPEQNLGSKIDVSGARKEGIDNWVITSTGKCIEYDSQYSVVCNDFIFNGGDSFNFTKAMGAYELDTSLRNALISQLSFEYKHDLVT